MIFLQIFILLLAISASIHLLYPVILKIISRGKPEIIKDSSHIKPDITVIVPVFNESSVIERRLINLMDNDYKGQIEVMVVDSGSTDDTVKIIKDKFSNRVELVQETERRGKAHAVNLAMIRSKGEIVLLTDAPTLYRRNTISEIARMFVDPSIGAVSAAYEIPNLREYHTAEYESIFWSHKEKLRLLESKVHSTSWLSGEACAFRRNILQEVSEDTIADDTNIALQVIKRGYRVIITDRTAFLEASPTERVDYIRVKSRRALGGIQEILRFRSLLFNRRYGLFGTFIFPYRIYAELISPVVILSILVLIPIIVMELFLQLNVYFSFGFALGVGVLFFLFRRKMLALLYVQIICLRAITQFLAGRRDVKWVQSKTTR